MAGWGGVYPLLTGEIAHKGSRAGGNGRLLAFKLDATGKLAPRPELARANPEPPVQFADAATIESGMQLFHVFCAGCHGQRAISGGVLPDLRISGFTARAAAWSTVVLDGALRASGMVGFARELSEADAEAIRAYVLERAIEDYRPPVQPGSHE